MSENTGTDLAVVQDNDVADAIAQLQEGRTALYSSIKGDDQGTRRTVLKAVMSSKAIADNLDKPFKLNHVIVQPTEMLNESTGVYETQPRVILLDEKGTAYHAISKVIFRDIENILAILGEPTSWDGPLDVKVVREGSGNRKFFRLELV